MKFKSVLAVSMFAFSAILVSGQVSASGSDSFSSARTGEAAAYQLGKKVFAKNYSCKTCPLYKQRLNKDLAEQILTGEPKVDLSKNDAAALQAFLQRRFKL